MRRINLLEDGLNPEENGGYTPGDESRNAGDVAPPEENDGPKVSIPRGTADTASGTEGKKVRPRKSPLSRGPSLGFIIFLLVITALVTAYYLFIQEPKTVPPTPVPEDQSETTTTVSGQQEAGGTATAAGIAEAAIRTGKAIDGGATQGTGAGRTGILQGIRSGQQGLLIFSDLMPELVHATDLRMFSLDGGRLTRSGYLLNGTDAASLEGSQEPSVELYMNLYGRGDAG